jgi:uncharacterized membrane protein YhaH (DUF805 family)
MRDYHEQVDMAEAVRRALSNYANFSGRANRGEYWWFVLANIIVSIVLSVIDSTVFGTGFGQTGILSGLYSLAMLIPGLSIGARRLHDIDKSGWWLLIALVPIVGAIVLIVWLATKGQSTANRFG